MRTMLINATHSEECRVAIVENKKLIDLEIERSDQIQLKGNIYKASISRVEPSLQAAFLDIGSSRNGFLQINDIHSTYFDNFPSGDKPRRSYRPPIQEVLRAGQELVVQVVKDEREAKGATLTTNLSIPGRYLVLMIGNQRGGVSRKIADEGHRKRLKQAVEQLTVPPGMGVIVRTAGLSKSTTELQKDLDGLLHIWFEIVSKSLSTGVPTVLYEESDLATRSIRDYLRSDFDRVIFDEKNTFDRAYRFAERIVPSLCSKLVLDDNPAPLFARFGIEEQVRAATLSEIVLPSGGSIIISPTEAIVSIDVNSGRSTSRADVEETAFQTNVEAAEIVAEQLRLRDLGGLVVIDFIDMLDKRHKQIVERTLKDAVRVDRAKIEIGRISKFGLLEMSRQRLKGSLVMQNHSVCPNCRGKGLVRMSDSVGLEALRKIETAVYAGGIRDIRVHLNPSSALFLLNEKRLNLSSLEVETGAKVRIYADSRLRPDEYELILDTHSKISASSGAHDGHRTSQTQTGHGSSKGDSPASGKQFSDERQGKRKQRSRNSRRPERNRRDYHNRTEEAATSEMPDSELSAETQRPTQMASDTEGRPKRRSRSRQRNRQDRSYGTREETNNQERAHTDSLPGEEQRADEVDTKVASVK